jgi:uncharacterized membrane protein HdeD (DUF308 family)
MTAAEENPSEVITTEEEKALEPVSGKIRKNRGWLLFLGVVMVILGTIGLTMEVSLTVVSVLYFGFLVVFGGIIMLIDAFKAGAWQSKIWHVLMALVYIAAGIVMIIDPAASAVWITLFLAGFFVVSGACRLIIGFQSRASNSSWGWIVFAGLISIALGGIIFAQWPVSGLWVIGMFVAIELIIQGFSMISIAWAARSND